MLYICCCFFFGVVRACLCTYLEWYIELAVIQLIWISICFVCFLFKNLSVIVSLLWFSFNHNSKQLTVIQVTFYVTEFPAREFQCITIEQIIFPVLQTQSISMNQMNPSLYSNLDKMYDTGHNFSITNVFRDISWDLCRQILPYSWLILSEYGCNGNTEYGCNQRHLQIIKMPQVEW